jgi:hypothetical protein
MTVPEFSAMTAETPTFEGVQAEMQQIHTAFDNAKTDAERVAAFERWNDIKRRNATWGSLVGLHFNQDTRNAEYKKARDYRDKLAPKLTNLQNDFKRKVLATLINGGISVLSPAGGAARFIAVADPLTTNICFGGADLRTAFVTASSIGELLALEWDGPGLQLNFLNH